MGAIRAESQSPALRHNRNVDNAGLHPNIRHQNAHIYLCYRGHDDHAAVVHDSQNSNSAVGQSNYAINKLYIVLNFGVILFVFLNFLGSFTTTDTSKILY